MRGAQGGTLCIKRGLFHSSVPELAIHFISFSFLLWLMDGGSSMTPTSVRRKEALTKAFQQADIMVRLP